MLVEAFGIDVVDVLVECVYLVVEYIGIGTANDTAILELTLEYFYSGSNELAFLVETDFQLDFFWVAWPLRSNNTRTCIAFMFGISFLVSFLLSKLVKTSQN